MNTNNNSENIEPDLLARFYKGIPSALAANILNAIFVVAVLWESMPNNTLGLWLASLLAILTFRFSLYQRYQSTVNKNNFSWKTTAITTTTITGIIWSALPIMLIDYGTTIHLTFLTLILAGITAGALSSSSAFRIAYILFITPPLTALLILLLIRGGAEYYSFAVLIPFFHVLLLRSNSEDHRTLCNALVLRYSNSELANKMEKMNKELECEVHTQKEISEKLVESEAMFRSLSESAEMTILVYGGSQEVLYLNPACEKLLDCDAETIKKQPFGAFIHPDDRNALMIRAQKRLNGEEVPNHYQSRILDYSEKVHWVDLSAAPISYQGQPAVILTAIDISHLKESELLLVDAKDKAEEASQAKSEFLSAMSHELRTPLNAVLGFSQLLSSDTVSPLNQSQKGSVKMIMDAGQHLLSLIDDVLDLEKIETGRTEVFLEPTDIKDLVTQVCTLIYPSASQRSLTIENITVDISPIKVKADEGKLTQVLLNIASNAVKYNSENGTITFTCNEVENNKVRIAISDTGSGVDEALFPQLFEPFNRLDKTNSAIQGTGIGLTISKQLVGLMGGEIGVFINPDKGLTFWVELDKA